MLNLMQKHLTKEQLVEDVKFFVLLNAGLKRGEIRPCDIDKVSNHIFTLLEAFCFQIAFLGNFSAEDSKDFVATYLDAYRIHKG